MFWQVMLKKEGNVSTLNLIVAPAQITNSSKKE